MSFNIMEYTISALTLYLLSVWEVGHLTCKKLSPATYFFLGAFETSGPTWINRQKKDQFNKN